MEVAFTGECFRKGPMKKGGFWYKLIGPKKADDSRDEVTVFSQKDYKLGANVTVKGDARIEMITEK